MYDAIVIGARCAGAPTAMLLARKGYRVLLVDRAAFPSDMPMSTHLIHQPGVASLMRWGLLGTLTASGCPPISTYHWNFGAFTLQGCPVPLDGITEAYAPRRLVLDSLLVDAAVAAGAELREHLAVRDVLVDDGRVIGIRARTQAGITVTETARIIVGADGMNSLVARAVEAPEYHMRPPLQGPFFTYWSGVQVDGFEFYPDAGRGTFGWMTNDGLALVACAWAIKDVPQMRADLERNYHTAIEAIAPSLAERLRRGTREQRIIGGPIDNYIRRPYGPGWALVGDAGYKKDPCTAAGITDAFRDAELLSDALDAGFSERQPLDEALAAYEQKRNEVALPMYEFTCQLAAMAPPPPDMQNLLASLASNQEATNQYFGVFAQTVAVPTFFAPQNIARITGLPNTAAVA